MTEEEKKRNKIFEAEYLHGAGFCGTCGEGLTSDPEKQKVFGHCPFKGNHPKESSK